MNTKKLLGYFFLLTLLVPSLGTSVWFIQQQKRVRKEVKQHLIAGVEDSELTLLIFSEEDKSSLLEWEHEKEFQFEGTMYDIVREDKIGELHYYWCWKDDKETALYKKYEELLAKMHDQNSNEGNSQSHWLQFCLTLYLSPTNHWEPVNPIIQKTPDNETYVNFYHSLALQPLSPPPNFV